MILNWKEFITEKLSQDEVLDLYNHFIRILKIHEDFFHHDNSVTINSYVLIFLIHLILSLSFLQLKKSNHSNNHEVDPIH